MDSKELKCGLARELKGDILPFWMERMKDPSGGFYGRIDGTGERDADAPKGGILNARILWTFASAARLFGEEPYFKTAARAFSEIRDRFQDPEYGGIYWSLDASGKPLETKKQFYAIAFAIYALAEYFRACGDREALDLAVRFWCSIEDHSYDSLRDGYLEAATREWAPIADMRLSEKDRNDAKTMNTHLHILEGYTGLYRVWKDRTLGKRLEGLIRIFLDRIIRQDGHLGLFFDEDWNPTSETVSYGHDIEASWLLYEAAEVLGNKDLIEEVRAAAVRLSDAALEGYREDGSMVYESDPVTGHTDTDRHWWVQAETVVGCLNRARISGEGEWAGRAIRTWDFIRNHLLAPDGEWYWSVREDGSPNLDEDRAGFWKCPYHNGRMCMEIIENY